MPLGQTMLLALEENDLEQEGLEKCPVCGHLCSLTHAGLERHQRTCGAVASERVQTNATTTAPLQDLRELARARRQGTWVLYPSQYSIV